MRSVVGTSSTSRGDDGEDDSASVSSWGRIVPAKYSMTEKRGVRACVGKTSKRANKIAQVGRDVGAEEEQVRRNLTVPGARERSDLPVGSHSIDCSHDLAHWHAWSLQPAHLAALLQVSLTGTFLDLVSASLYRLGRLLNWWTHHHGYGTSLPHGPCAPGPATEACSLPVAAAASVSAHVEEAVALS